MTELLKLLEKDATLTPTQLSKMLGIDINKIEAKLNEYENNKTILGCYTLINWEKVNDDEVTALIEVKVTPQRGEGFDRVAERICQFKEVDSVYLMSGGFDLTVIIKGKSMKEIAFFVAEKLAVMESVAATATHFILKKYKEHSVIFNDTDLEEKRILSI